MYVFTYYFAVRLYIVRLYCVILYYMLVTFGLPILLCFFHDNYSIHQISLCLRRYFLLFSSFPITYSTWLGSCIMSSVCNLFLCARDAQTRGGTGSCWSRKRFHECLLEIYILKFSNNITFVNQVLLFSPSGFGLTTNSAHNKV